MTTVITVEHPELREDLMIMKMKWDNDHAELTIDFSELNQFATNASKEALDFFIISACVYGIDRFIPRRRNSVDGWTRELEVELPVLQVSKWKRHKEDLESLVSFLTGDYWKITFKKSQLSLEDEDLDSVYEQDFAQVSLFSGGLDSLVGAINFLEDNPKRKLALISHYDQQMGGPKGDQAALLKELEKEYPNRFVHVPSVNVFLNNSTLTQKETTFRSRSILFIGIATLVAKAKGIPIEVPENGSVSLNFPLSKSRRSACSTRTTHPTFIDGLEKLLVSLDIQVSILTPFEFYTKREVVDHCKNSKLLKRVVHLSNSCGKRGHRANWTYPDRSHCGVCMPCVYRQASLMNVIDKTSYGNAINKVLPSGKNFFLSKQGQDLGACLHFLKNPLTPQDIRYELLANGLKDLDRIDKYVEVVIKTREELKKWVKKTGESRVKDIAGL